MPEQEIGDGVRRHGVAQPVLADDQPLVARPHRNPATHWSVHEAEDGRGDDEESQWNRPNGISVKSVLRTK